MSGQLLVGGWGGSGFKARVRSWSQLGSRVLVHFGFSEINLLLNWSTLYWKRALLILNFNEPASRSVTGSFAYLAYK